MLRGWEMAASAANGFPAQTALKVQSIVGKRDKEQQMTYEFKLGARGGWHSPDPSVG